MNARRELTLTAVACVVAAGLVLLAASRTWQVALVARPAPLGPLRTPQTGGALVPALPAMGLVVLAGAGALFATGALARRMVGVLVLVCGLVAAVLGAAWSGRAGVAAGWPVLALVGGLLAAAGGAFTASRGGSWPGLGRRYDLPDARATSPVHSGQSGAPDGGADPAGGTTDRTGGAEGIDGTQRGGATGRSRDLWDALDRGEDPTR